MILVAGLLVAGGLSAQSFEDVLRTSEVFPRGNARFMSMSGAMGALGGNMSAISVNPAGSAILRNGAIEITPAFSFVKSENHFQGNYNRRFETAFRVPNFGIMGAWETPNGGVISGVSLGFVLNNQNMFDASMRYETAKAESSLTDEALWQANNDVWSDWTDLFWNSYLLREDNFGFFTDFTEFNPATYNHRQTAVINTSGGKNEYMFNFGIDFSQYVYVGADLSIQGINYRQGLMIEERNNTQPTDVPQNLDFFGDFLYRENLAVSGNGVMGKFGIIARPVEFLRLGAAFHTPTTFFLTEEQNSRVNSNFNYLPDPDQNFEEDPDQVPLYITSGSDRLTRTYDYNITIPGRAIASLGLVFKNIAMIGVDYESVNYQNAYIDAHRNDFAFTETNDAVESRLTRTDNIKIGGEVNYGMYSLRLGTAFYGNPYVERKNEETFYRTDISAGLGIKTEGGFYCDFAWVKSAQTKYKFLYQDYDGNVVEGKSKIKKTDFALTVGFKF